MKLVIVSNRLPFTLEKTEKGLLVKQSVGGVATGIHAYISSNENIEGTAFEVLWYGSPGQVADSLEAREIRYKLSNHKMYYPVFLSENLHKGFYSECCNETIYPLLTGFCQNYRFFEASWDCYKKVNRLYSKLIADNLNEGDIVWVNDYHFLLLPFYLRQLKPNIAIGFFLHTPFPEREIIGRLPINIQKSIIEGMLGADLIGFHIDEYKSNFIETVQNVLEVTCEDNMIVYNRKTSRTGSFPMGIDFKKYQLAGLDENKSGIYNIGEGNKNKRKTFLSVDRLDYTKGITNKLWAYEILLERYPCWRGNISLVMIVAPSRTDIREYKQLKNEIDEFITNINMRYGSDAWTPIEYHYRQVDFPELVKYYSDADIAIVTPIKDGMNLVAKEFISSRIRRDGVLILSKEAGAKEELREALMVNPSHISEIARVMNKALCMQLNEQKSRISSMQKKIRKYDVFKWVGDILKQTVSSTTSRNKVPAFDEAAIEFVYKKYISSEKRILFLDYDGTLVPLRKDPATAVPDTRLLQLISAIVSQPNTQIIIVSGREASFLETSFNTIDIDYAAEYGSVLKINNSRKLGGDVKSGWKDDAKSIIENMNISPGNTFIEEKEYSMVLHFKRNSIVTLENYFSLFADRFSRLTEKYFLEIIQAKNSIEIKQSSVNKGKAIQHWLQKERYDFVMAIGDDISDEDMFGALPTSSFSVRIGEGSTHATFTASDHLRIRQLLEKFARIPTEKYAPAI